MKFILILYFYIFWHENVIITHQLDPTQPNPLGLNWFGFYMWQIRLGWTFLNLTSIGWVEKMLQPNSCTTLRMFSFGYWTSFGHFYYYWLTLLPTFILCMSFLFYYSSLDVLQIFSVTVLWAMKSSIGQGCCHPPIAVVVLRPSYIITHNLCEDTNFLFPKKCSFFNRFIFI